MQISLSVDAIDSTKAEAEGESIRLVSVNIFKPNNVQKTSIQAPKQKPEKPENSLGLKRKQRSNSEIFPH